MWIVPTIRAELGRILSGFGRRFRSCVFPPLFTWIIPAGEQVSRRFLLEIDVTRKDTCFFNGVIITLVTTDPHQARQTLALSGPTPQSSPRCILSAIVRLLKRISPGDCPKLVIRKAGELFELCPNGFQSNPVAPGSSCMESYFTKYLSVRKKMCHHRVTGG